MRLRNRQLKATYYTDPELLRWPRPKREFYRSLWACAEDSCCLEDDMFGVKIAAWASPVDDDMTIELFEQWRDEMIADGKLVRYESGGDSYLYIPAMAAHERPRNPQPNDYPLPSWVVKEVSGEGRGQRVNFTHGNCTDTVQTLYTDPRPVLSSPVQSSPEQRTDVPVRANALPPCLTQVIEGVSWADCNDHFHPSPAAAFWSTLEHERGSLLSPADTGTFAAIVGNTCPAGCAKDSEAIGRCLDALVKAAAKTHGKPSPLFRRICEEDR